MNSPIQKLSNLVKRTFESEEIIREKWLSKDRTNFDSLMFWIKQKSRREIQSQWQWEENFWEDMEKNSWKISNETKKQYFRHIFEREHYDDLIDLRKDFSIKLFKELSIGSKSLRVDKDVSEILDKQREIIKDTDWIHSRIIMRPWDLEIVFKESLKLSESVKKFEIPRKTVPRVIIKGKNCFLQTRTPDGFLADDLLTIELATQEDIKNIFELINNIL